MWSPHKEKQQVRGGFRRDPEAASDSRFGARTQVVRRRCRVMSVSMSLDLPGSRRIRVEIGAVAHALNTRPRKTLGSKTPAEAFNEHLLLLQQAGVASTG